MIFHRGMIVWRGLLDISFKRWFWVILTRPIPHRNDVNETICTKRHHVSKAFLSRSFSRGQDNGAAEALQAVKTLDGLQRWRFLFTSIDPYLRRGWKFTRIPTTDRGREMYVRSDSQNHWGVSLVPWSENNTYQDQIFFHKEQACTPHPPNLDDFSLQKSSFNVFLSLI